MQGKRARRHFSQLSEFQRGLIIGMKTAGWSTRLVAGQVDCSECAVRNCWKQWTREDTHVWKAESGTTRKTTRREDRRIMRQALVDPTVTRSMIRVDVGVAIVPQIISRHLAKQILNPRALSRTPFNTGTLTTASTVVPSQINVECHKLAKMLCLVMMNPVWFWKQIITVYWCRGAHGEQYNSPTLFYVRDGPHQMV
ncbi:uncharacterized protein TNCV_4177511 [Trichonephila clavipes]|nr:uncharacterized protein TNCV_4177511 [Trichonephila clavipes]